MTGLSHSAQRYTCGLPTRGVHARVIICLECCQEGPRAWNAASIEGVCHCVLLVIVTKFFALKPQKNTDLAQKHARGSVACVDTALQYHPSQNF